MARQPRKTKNSASPEAASGAAHSSSATATLDRSLIQERAYQLYLARGGSQGQELDDWLRAEAELSSQKPLDRN